MASGALARPQKGADEQRSTIVWVDESAFYLLPLAVRTWAPKGQTPTLRVPLTHDHLSVIKNNAGYVQPSITQLCDATRPQAFDRLVGEERH